MEVKSLFDNTVKQDIVNRINKLTPQSQPLWGKMNAGQMLAHCQMPIGVALGDHKLKRTFIGFLFGPVAKKILYNDKPFKRHLPTDKSFIMKEPKDFEKEKMKLLDMLNRFIEINMIDEPHPFFGRLTKEQWSIGSWKHLDHHLQQFGV
ncbi:MAG: DUF1569 domain-containing protein [Chitinophagaceae bacterium]|nr:MAG: DUF1569 domain-containing protein [Chitinophagaceae bacterium]